MAAAVRVGDVTNHGGTVIGPGVSNVLIGGMPAAVAMDNHQCVIPPNTGHLTVSMFPMGSPTVMIGGKQALRVGDSCLCGASAVVGCVNVMIG